MSRGHKGRGSHLLPPPALVRAAPQCLVVLLQLREALLQLAQQETQLLGLCRALLQLAALLRQHEDDLQCGQVAVPWAHHGPSASPAPPERPAEALGAQHPL